MPIGINGSGSITGISAGGLPNGTVTQAELATGVSGTGPAFSAYRTTAQTGVSSATWTKVQLNFEYFDTANCYDNATNYRFTPNVAGYYDVKCSVFLNGTSMTNAGTSFYKNGSLYSYNVFVTAGSTTVSSGSNIIYFNGTTDYVEVYGIATVGSGTVSFGNDTTLCQFSAAMVRGA